MKIINKKNDNIINESSLNSKFLSVFHNDLKMNCNTLTDTFFLDSYNYFPITESDNSFLDTFKWGNIDKYKNFYSDEFYSNFKKNLKDFKKFSDVYILGSSSNNNYYRNIITFLPRLFFIKEKSIKIAIHRSCSNNFRNFIKTTCLKMNIKIQFVYLDDGFFKFENSKIPQFFEKKDSVQILNTLKSKNEKNDKIYIVRQNTAFRNVINENDVVEIFKNNGFRIVDTKRYDIFEQINIFSNASLVVSATGSGLTNIVFCNKNTKIVEIAPNYKYKYEDNFKSRFSDICKYLDLKYYCFNADSIDISKVDTNISKKLGNKALKESNYYKDLLLKLQTIDEILKI